MLFHCFIDPTSTLPKLLEVFESLSKRLRGIEDLPLQVVSVQPVSAGNVLVRNYVIFLGTDVLRLTLKVIQLKLFIGMIIDLFRPLEMFMLWKYQFDVCAQLSGMQMYFLLSPIHWRKMQFHRKYHQMPFLCIWNLLRLCCRYKYTWDSINSFIECVVQLYLT